MKLVVSCNELRYGGQTYLNGEPFETVTERDGEVLKLLRKAVAAPSVAPAGPRPLQTLQSRDLQAEAAQTPAAEPSAPSVSEPAAPPAQSAEQTEAPVAAQAQARRTYRRRDMKAEG